MSVTLEAVVEEGGNIRVRIPDLHPGTRVKVWVEPESNGDRKLQDPGSMEGTGEIVGDIVSPLDDWEAS